MMDILTHFIYSVSHSGSSGNAIALFLIGTVGLSLIAIIFRFITRIKSFALFGG